MSNIFDILMHAALSYKTDCIERMCAQRDYGSVKIWDDETEQWPGAVFHAPLPVELTRAGCHASELTQQRRHCLRNLFYLIKQPPRFPVLLTIHRNRAELDQFLGRPIINVTDEGHISTKNPLLAPYIVKITKM